MMPRFLAETEGHKHEYIFYCKANHVSLFLNAKICCMTNATGMCLVWQVFLGEGINRVVLFLNFLTSTSKKNGYRSVVGMGISWKDNDGGN